MGTHPGRMAGRYRLKTAGGQSGKRRCKVCAATYTRQGYCPECGSDRWVDNDLIRVCDADCVLPMGHGDHVPHQPPGIVEPLPGSSEDYDTRSN